jgi:hypothetical protein
MIIDELIKKLCEVGADSACRYVKVSGQWLDEMPEHFMPAYVLDHLYPRIEASMTMEARVLTLLPEDRRFSNLAVSRVPELDAAKIDLIIHDGGGRPPQDQMGMALVEFKRGWVGADREKLRAIMNYLGEASPPYGIECGWVAQGHRQEAKVLAQEAGDNWFETPFLIDTATFFFCARYFGR